MERAIEIFKSLNKIPRGSGNMEKVAEFIVEFAKKNNLRSIRDEYNNVIVYKEATCGYENKPPVILQGHLDMVCQKEEGSAFDFDACSIEVFEEEGWLKAKGTTLGADNGLGVAMTLEILENNELSHPPIEAVFTTDEEIGMIGATGLDTSLLKGKTLINLDSEDEDLTVSCAGGSDFMVKIPVEKVKSAGDKITVKIRGLMGGHSGVEIHKGGENASCLMGKVLEKLEQNVTINLIEISGGDKANAITNSCIAEFITTGADLAKEYLKEILEDIKKDIKNKEPGFEYEICEETECETKVFAKESTIKVTKFLANTPQGVQKMSDDIEGLVETSLNLGVLKTCADFVFLGYALRSSKKEELEGLAVKMKEYALKFNALAEESGYYPPWEYKEDSKVRPLFVKTYKEISGKDINVTAIHAGLECAVFASKIEGVDCIATGPVITGAHTIFEKADIKSADTIYKTIVNVLKNM